MQHAQESSDPEKYKEPFPLYMPERESQPQLFRFIPVYGVFCQLQRMLGSFNVLRMIREKRSLYLSGQRCIVDEAVRRIDEEDPVHCPGGFRGPGEVSGIVARIHRHDSAIIRRKQRQQAIGEGIFENQEGSSGGRRVQDFRHSVVAVQIDRISVVGFGSDAGSSSTFFKGGTLSVSSTSDITLILTVLEEIVNKKRGAVGLRREGRRLEGYFEVDWVKFSELLKKIVYCGSVKL